MAPKIGWFFSGGGCRGLVVETSQARALGEFCTKKNIPIENIAFLGTSVGAILASFLGQAHTWDDFFNYCNKLDEIINKFNTIGPELIFDVSAKRIIIDSRHQSSILSPNKLYDLIDGKIFGTRPLDTKKVIQSPIPVHILTTNMSKQVQEVFTSRQKRIIDNPRILRHAVVASASLPPFFSEISINGDRYRDGARMNLGSLIKEGYDIIFILLNQSRIEDFTETENSRHWWPWIPPIFQYQSAVISGIERSEIRQVRKSALDKAFDIYTYKEMKEAGQKLEDLQLFRRKKKQVKNVISELLKLIEYHIGNHHIAYPIPIYAPKLPKTLRVESIRKEEFQEQKMKNVNGATLQKNRTITYEGDLKRVARESYASAKEILSLVDLNHPEQMPIL